MLKTFDIQAALDEAISGESEQVEWKEADSDAVVRSACAFANDLGNCGRPGFILIGVDKRGDAVDADVSDEAIQRVVNRLTATKILPNPSCGVQRAKHQGREILVVRVEPYPVPPVVKVNGVAWVRVGTSTRRANEVDLLRLNERRPESHQPFDIRPFRDADLDALDRRRMHDQYDLSREADLNEESFPEFEKWLAQRNMARLADDRWIPTAAAILVHGVDPLTYFPGARVEFARYDGDDVDAPVISRRPVTGDLPSQLDTIWAQLNANNAEVAARDEGIRTIYAPEYPIEALKELARNLVQHRLYEGTNAPGRVSWFRDRIEFYNPGRPFGLASEGEFGTHADYRNPTIGGLLVDQGHVDPPCGQ